MALTAQQLLKTEGALTANPDDSLASALSQMSSSHDAVFVFDKDKLLGLISPYHALYRSAYPPATKVKNCLFSPPKLKPETRADTIARLMLEAKVYFLPVISGVGRWLGVVSFRQLLRRQKNLGLKLKPKELVKIKETATVGVARNLMKTSGVSRLVAVSDSGRLAGILTRYDLGEALGRPQKKVNYLGRVGEKYKAADAPVRPLIKHDVMTIKVDETVDTAVNLMLDKRIGSVVIVNNDWKPVGLISVRDCLEAVARPPLPLPAFNLKLPPGFPYTDRFMKLFSRYFRQWRVRFPLLKFDLKLNVHKNAAHIISGYKVLLQAKPAHQREVTARGSGRNWKVALRKSLSRLGKQLGRR